MSQKELNDLYEEVHFIIDNADKKELFDYIIKNKIENQELKEQPKKYEDPNDLTLMFMYCDEKAKDKIRELEKQLEEKNIEYFKGAYDSNNKHYEQQK